MVSSGIPLYLSSFHQGIFAGASTDDEADDDGGEVEEDDDVEEEVVVVEGSVADVDEVLRRHRINDGRVGKLTTQLTWQRGVVVCVIKVVQHRRDT